MKAFKIILVIVALLVVLALGALFYLSSNLNGIVKNVIETEGPKVTQTQVTVGGVDIQPRQGRGELNNFVIGNPKGFESSDAFHAEQLVLQVKPSSLLGDVIIIEEVTVKGVTVTAEQKGLTTNLQTLLKSMQQGGGAEDEPEGESDVRLMVEKIRFSDSAVNLITEEHGDYVVDLPGLELDNIGTAERGLTPAQLGKAIAEPVIQQARTAAEERIKKLAQDKAEDKLKEKAKEKLGDDAEEKLKGLRGMLD